MKKYLQALIVLAVAISFFVAACQPAAQPATVAPAAPAEPAAPAATDVPAAVVVEAPASQHEPVTLHFLKIQDDLEAKAFAEMVDAWHKVDGGKWAYVTVEYDYGSPSVTYSPLSKKQLLPIARLTSFKLTAQM